MRRVKSDSSLSAGISSVAVPSPQQTKIMHKSVSCAALTDVHSHVPSLRESLEHSIMQAPISVSGPCIELYGFPKEIIQSHEKTADFMACIMTPPDPIEQSQFSINPIRIDDIYLEKFERLMRGVLQRRRKKVAEN